MLDDDANREKYRILCDEELKYETLQSEQIASVINTINGKAYNTKSGRPRSASFVPPHFGTNNRQRKIEKNQYYEKTLKVEDEEDVTQKKNANTKSTEKVKQNDNDIVSSTLHMLEEKYPVNIQIMEQLLKERNDTQKELNHIKKMYVLGTYRKNKKLIHNSIDKEIMNGIENDDTIVDIYPPIRNHHESSSVNKHHRKTIPPPNDDGDVDESDPDEGDECAPPYEESPRNGDQSLPEDIINFVGNNLEGGINHVHDFVTSKDNMMDTVSIEDILKDNDIMKKILMIATQIATSTKDISHNLASNVKESSSNMHLSHGQKVDTFKSKKSKSLQHSLNFQNSLNQ
jgi:hypothetical protein